MSMRPVAQCIFIFIFFCLSSPVSSLSLVCPASPQPEDSLQFFVHSAPAIMADEGIFTIDLFKDYGQPDEETCLTITLVDKNQNLGDANPSYTLVKVQGDLVNDHPADVNLALAKGTATSDGHQTWNLEHAFTQTVDADGGKLEGADAWTIMEFEYEEWEDGQRAKIKVRSWGDEYELETGGEGEEADG